MNPIALVGFGPSRKLIYKLPDMPVWSLSDAVNYDLPRIDRVFEMHPIRDLVLEGERWERLQTNLPYPVYMLEKHEEVPSSVRYPLDMVLEEVFKNIYTGPYTARYLDSSFPYMIALAVLEGYDPVYLVGCELRTDTEYRYQRIGVSLIVGWAAGRGTTVVLPEKTALLPPTLYGYDDFQHVSREELYELYKLIKDKYDNYLTLKKKASDKLLRHRSDENTEEFGLQYKRVAQAEGGLHVLKGLIEICNSKKIETGENDQYISRSNLEQVLHEMANQESDWMGRLNVAHARVIERQKTGEDLDKAKEDREHAFQQMYMRSGAIHTVRYLIEMLDRGIAEFEEFDDHYFVYSSS